MQALAALVFLYRVLLGRDLGHLDGVTPAHKPKRLPVVLTRPEVRAVVGQMRGVPRLVAALLYGAGMRLLGCLSLRVKDVDFSLRQITIRGGKGDRDRVTVLPGSVVPDLEAHLAVVQRRYQRDVALGLAEVALPGALDRKFPNAAAEWAGQWVFPAGRTSLDRASGRRRRYHLHASLIQREFKAAVRRSGIAKRATCHTLRHSFATHLLEAGSGD